MTLPRTVADVLSDHVAFEVECIDRMYLNVYVPQLQYATGLVPASAGTWASRLPRRRCWRR
jgi:hypothetical protein